MSTKLTLLLDEKVIAQIKDYTNRQQISLSKFTENMFRRVLEYSDKNNNGLPPIVAKYKGIIKNSEIDEIEELTTILTSKHS